VRLRREQRDLVLGGAAVLGRVALDLARERDELACDWRRQARIRLLPGATAAAGENRDGGCGGQEEERRPGNEGS
jgi:hypothetical protein